MSAVDNAEIEEEELDGVVDESTEQEFSFKDFVLRYIDTYCTCHHYM